MTELPLDSYLARIRWSGAVSPSEALLDAWHFHQLMAVPFENVDPRVGRPISLKRPDLCR